MSMRRFAEASTVDLAKQQSKDECDINNILRRYERTGMLSHLAEGVPTYMDVSEVGDYRSAMEHLRSTEKFFMGLPARVREQFGNDPVEFIDQVSSLAPKELDELLAEKAEELVKPVEPAGTVS